VTTTVLAYIPSPSQGVWHLGVIPIRAYALFIIVGIVAALVIGDRRWVARGGHAGVIYDIALWAVPFGLVGGRLYHVMTDWRTYFGDDGAGLAGALRIWDGGLGIWGAVALGGVGAWIGCRQKGIPLPAFGDAIAPGIVLAQAIGRLGNYFNQELYGRPTTLPWGLEIFERRDANGALDTLNGASTGQLIEVVHPTFLYELLWNVLVFAALIWIDRRFKVGHGRLFAMYVAGYCAGRFWVELMRSDVATHIAGIRVNSFTSTFVFIGAVVYIMVAPKGREDPASLAGKQPEKVEHEEDTVEAFAKELTAVAAATGVVAAAKAAGDVEGEDAKAAAGDDEDEKAAEPEAPEAEEPEESSPEVKEPQAEADTAEQPDEPEAEAEPDADEEAEEPEAQSDVAVEAKAEPEEPEAEPETAEVKAPETAEAEEAETAEAEEPETAEAEEPETAEAEEPESDEEAEDEAAADEEPSSEAAAEAAEAEAAEAAEDVSDAPREAIEDAEAGEQAEQVEADAESDDSEPDEPETDEPEPDEPETDEPETDEPETEAAEAAVGEAADEPSEEEAAEAAEAVVEEADSAAEEEPTTGVLEEAKVEAIADEPEPVEKPEADESGGRLGRWLRRNR
jgi:prolipoprotein diacylglyceryl transferase